MKQKLNIILFLILCLTGSCITQFVPEITENREMLVVEGVLTDNPAEPTRVKLTRSLPLGSKDKVIPVTGCYVWISDNDGHDHPLYETNHDGNYYSEFRGTVGKTYVLHIRTNDYFVNDIYPSVLTFQSYPMEMKPVPPIDTIYYEKREIVNSGVFSRTSDACQVYIDTKDPANECKFFRWDYDETWEIFLPFARAINPSCWITRRSDEINVKSTAGLSQSVVSGYPINFIGNETDRLKVKYSMLVNQYSLNEDEFTYWEKLKAVTQNVGSLYDITPAAIPNNIFCNEDASERVLGYFSVSSMKSKRIFIRDFFRGQPNLYADCIHDTIFGSNPVIPNLNVSVWILEQHLGPPPPNPFTAITYTKGCADCTTRGSKERPSFWE